MKGILGKKLGMSRIVKDGIYIPVTIVQCSPNIIHQIKTAEKDGYSAVALGFDPKKKPTKTKKFHLVKEFRFESTEGLEKGKTIDIAAILTEGDRIAVTSTTKGKGFQGVVRRFNFSGGPGSHGSHFHREPGSVGARAKPGKIHLGKKLPGRMGGEQQTLKTSVEYIDLENHLVGIKGPVPGSINSYVTIKKIA